LKVEAVLATDGLRCPSCAYAVERLGRKIAGVEDIRVDAATGEIRFTYDGDPSTPRRISDIVARLGHSTYAS
jgi:copper chaperone CopZ